MSTAGLAIEDANDFMRLEGHLLALLKAAVVGCKPAVHVLAAADLADVKESAQSTPALHLIYGGYKLAEAVATRMRLVHTWHVAAAVRNVATQRSGSAAREDAGPLLVRALSALIGAAVPGAASVLRPVTPPRALYAAGFFYLPATFEVDTVFHKT